ncbi:MAG: YitT family protein, partial [Bacteroidales bacterium]|nr:YitT family protein [Bacteroidales bacterium]
MEQKAKRVLTGIKEYTIITIGLLLYTVGWNLFLIPNGLVGGGVTGIASIIYYSTGFPVSYSFFIINGILLAIALKVLGKSFGIKTV